MRKLEFPDNLLKEIPSELRVFSLEKPRTDRTAFLDIFAALDLMSGFYAFRWDDSDGWTTAERNDARVSINHHSGAVRFWLRLDVERPLNTPFSLVEPELEETARDFLEQTHLVEVPVDRLALRKIAYLQVQAASLTGEVRPAITLSSSVIFGREVDGVPISGPGGYVMIRVVADKSITAGTKVLRRHGATIRVAEVLPPEYAVGVFKRRLSTKGFERPVRVEKAELCYFERGEYDEQTVLEPAYVFVYTVETTNRFPYKSVEVFPAIRDSRQVWNPPKRYSRGGPAG